MQWLIYVNIAYSLDILSQKFNVPEKNSLLEQHTIDKFNTFWLRVVAFTDKWSLRVAYERYFTEIRKATIKDLYAVPVAAQEQTEFTESQDK